MHLNYSVMIKVAGLLTLIEGVAMAPCILAAILFEEMVGAVDGHRQNRNLCLLGKLESAGLELSHLVAL